MANEWLENDNEAFRRQFSVDVRLCGRSSIALGVQISLTRPGIFISLGNLSIDIGWYQTFCHPANWKDRFQFTVIEE